ncbi:ubiquitin carboxyl-terminal hydrolase MINDY-3 isoform X2 [Cajanus cajan]|uniref:ubiquitinyl hydrolase 1 n=1 Tax=Cajanus cajan TaxID=3821 RepID=A0A151S6W4_CAJCA|nr:ubiquitin carboxyl-terminal hydrolase MINDY-3 isoform X2 [Cajanus cajan]KYP50555.1 Protein CARP [Cajanus cajan]
MGDRGEDEDLQMAIRMSMTPEPKRSKPRDAVAGAVSVSPEDSPESKTRRRELMAAAAEKRMAAAVRLSPSKPPPARLSPSTPPPAMKGGELGRRVEEPRLKGVNSSKELSADVANQLFTMVFGNEVSKGILAQWSNQGIRYSSDPVTSMGLVQHEGGPCGVLAAIQAFVLKYIIFFSDELKDALYMPHKGLGASFKSQSVPSYNFSSLTEGVKVRALVRSMGEILFSCGSNRRAVIATLSIPENDIQHFEGTSEDEVIAKSLKGLSIESALDLQKVLRVETCTSQTTALQRLEANLSLFQSRMGALLFLISALLSRGLDLVQSDRDDPSLPLVTAPFGHASQEIVNLLLCGEAVPNVFDGRMDLGGGMFLKGISRDVEVGFLTLLESLNFCKVGQFLKSPKWPIWVVGSESHYTVLFALDPSVQNENELEGRETQIRKAFDAQDQSGGGGFISVEGFHQVLKETNIKFPPDKLEHLCSAGFIVWSEFWQVILDLDQSLGGLKDSSGLMGRKVFDLYHFNGIAKSDLNGSQVISGGETPLQRPRLTKLRVSVPPRWTPEEFMADVKVSTASTASESVGKDNEESKPESSQHAPLVDCIRTRWARAVCSWSGDPPSIV